MENYKIENGNVYCRGRIITGADPATFEVLSDYYTKDKNHVYWCCEVIAGAEPATFDVPQLFLKTK